MTKRVGVLGLMVAAAVGFFHPAVASAQDRNDYRHGYVQRDYHDRDRRGDDRWRGQEWRETRDRQDFRAQEWREHQWRERERYDRRPYYYSDPYPRPFVQFGYGFGR